MAQWQLENDRFVISGFDGVTVFTSTRRKTIPSGNLDLSILQAFAKSNGITSSAVVGMEQVHGSVIRVVDAVRPEALEGRTDQDMVIPSCDGLVTNQPNVSLIVRSADCLPLVAYDPNRRVIGAAHAGWRGLQTGIIDAWIRTMKTLGCRPDSLQIGIGPGIGACCYEVGQEFENWFPNHLQVRGKRRFLDLQAVAVAQLLKCGVPSQQITAASWCTCCDADNCLSYRRDGASGGRMATCVKMES